MTTHIQRSIDRPLRANPSYTEMWDGPDKGLVWCWERGRQKREAEPELAALAEKGELPILAWRGGVEEKLKIGKKSGTLQYLATWQGLRGQDLDITIDEERVIVCSRTEQAVLFSARLQIEEEAQ